MALKEQTFRLIILGSLGLTGLINGIRWVMAAGNAPDENDFK